MDKKADLTFDEFKTFIHSVVPAENCPVIKTLKLLNGRWTTNIIYELEKQDTIRFGELARRIPYITNTMLSNTLKDLEEKGIVARTQFNEIPPRVEYSLTESGKDMLKIYYEIALWGLKYLK